MPIYSSFTENPGAVLFGTLVTGAAVKYGVSWWMRWKRLSEFELVGRVAALYMYPVKSCQRISVQSGLCTSAGLQSDGIRDRHVLILLPDGTWVTQRQEPRMALICVSSHGDMLHLDAPDMPTLKFAKAPKVDKARVRLVKVKLDWLPGYEISEEANLWVSRFIGKPLKIAISTVDMEKRDSSTVKKDWNHNAMPGDQMAYSDYCSFNFLGLSSVEEVNKHMGDKPVSDKNFRTTVLVSGSKPYDEDYWREIKIGEDVRLRALDACTRCVLTNVDPDTGIADKSEHTLKTLRTFRRRDPYGIKPCLGVNAALNSASGIIRVGDPVYAIRASTPI